MKKTSVITTLLCLVAAAVSATDWPNWRGPNHNGISTETGWLTEWPAEGPPHLWKASVGTGFSSVSVSQGRLYTMGNKSSIETVYCFDAETGHSVWSYNYNCDIDPHYYEGGPSVTPTADGDKVYTLSRKGDLFCFTADTGKVVWRRQISQDSQAGIPTWGFASSPLIQGDLLIIDAGDSGMAVNKNTGKTAWGGVGDSAGYSSGVPFLSGSVQAVAFLTGKQAIVVSVADGKLIWGHPFEGFYGCNTADPIVSGDNVFVSSGYNKGALLLRAQGNSPAVVWQSAVMNNHINSCVLLDGFLYGVDGQVVDPSGVNLKCIDFQSGTVRWSDASLGAGSITVADHKIIGLSDKGELMLADATPTGFKPTARAQVLGGKCWTVPVLANGRIYCRNARGDLVCLDVKKK